MLRIKANGRLSTHPPTFRVLPFNVVCFSVGRSVRKATIGKPLSIDFKIDSFTHCRPTQPPCNFSSKAATVPLLGWLVIFISISRPILGRIWTCIYSELRKCSFGDRFWSHLMMEWRPSKVINAEEWPVRLGPMIGPGRTEAVATADGGVAFDLSDK